MLRCCPRWRIARNKFNPEYSLNLVTTTEINDCHHCWTEKRDKRTIWWLSRVNEIYRWVYWPPFYPFSNNFYKPWQFTKVHYFLHRKDRRYLGESMLHGSVTVNGFIVLLDWHQTNIWQFYMRTFISYNIQFLNFTLRLFISSTYSK